MQKVKWLHRELIAGPYLALVLSEGEWHQALSDCGVAKEDWVPWIKTPHADATMHVLTNKRSEMVCVVALRVREGVSGVQTASLLVHEAVHVWQEFRARIGESAPSVEFEAYSIQSIAQELMKAYQDTLR